MAETKAEPTLPRKRRRWLRALTWLFAVLIVLLVAVYFVATSSAFFQGAILPRLSKSLHAEVTVSGASISPFKEIILRDLKVQTTGQEPLVAASEVRARYSLMDILGGNIHVDEIALSSPTVVLVENPDGSSNLDPILKPAGEKPKEAKPEKPAAPSKPPQLDVKKLALTGATIRKVKLYKDGRRDVSELSNVNVTLADLKNGQAGNLKLDADIKVENSSPATNPSQAGRAGGDAGAPRSGLLQAKVNGSFDFSLSPDLKPASIKGNTHLAISRAEGAMGDLAALAADLDCEATPTDIKQIALRFQKSGARLGEVRVSGPFDMEKTEGRLTLELLAIDKQVLNLAGAKNGIDFGTTTLSSTNEIQLAKSGSVITAAGRFDADKAQLTRAQQTTPPLDLRAEYNVTVNSEEKTALLRGLTVKATQKENPLLRAELTSPMNLAWGNVTNALGDSALNLAVTNLDLADWKPFLGEIAPAGNVTLNLNLVSRQGGKQLTYDLNSQIENLTVNAGSNQIRQARVTLLVSGKASDLNRFNLDDYRLQFAQQGQPLVTVSGAGTYEQASQSADLQVTVQASLARLLQLFPQPDMSVSSGTAELKGRLTQKSAPPSQPSTTANRPALAQNVTGNLVLADFNGRFGKNEFKAFGATLDLDAGVTPRQIQIAKAAGRFTNAGNPGGSFDLSGTYDLTNKSGQLTAKLTDLNQNGLRPFLEPVLADKKLLSVAISGTASAQYDPQGDSAVKADLRVANLVVSDPKQQFPSTPLEGRMQVDASLRAQVADVRQFQITLTPTARATNQLQLTGKIDMSQTNAIQGAIKLAADSLDVTSYYDLFAKKTAEKARAPAAPEPAPATTPSETDQEPAAMKLPFHNFTVELSLRRLWLREIEVADLQAVAKLDGSRVTLNPFKLALNGAPADATLDLDLGRPGFKYDVSFNAQAVPLAPLVDSFEPERKGQMGGELIAKAKVSGAGVTGASLQKNLTGQFDVNCTNLNLSVLNLKNLVIKRLINVIVAIPQLLHNPEAGIGSLLGGVTGQGGVTDEVAKSPIDLISARGAAGAGRIDLAQAVVRSAAFQATAQGNIGLAPVLTNSTLEIPVAVSLGRSVANKIGLVPANTPTNAAYVTLPDFLTMRGTLGDPKEDINKLALTGMALKGIGGIIPAAGGKAGRLLEGIGGILTGRAPDSNAPANASTNQAAPSQSPVNDLLDLFKRPKK